MTSYLTRILDHIGFAPRPQQVALFEALIETDEVGTVAQAGTGCIQGDAEIIINRGGNGVRRTLRELVHKFNGGADAYGKRWNPAIPTMVQREAEDGTIRLAKLKAAWFSGIKYTYTVTTSTGRQVRATNQHPFLTERGWLRLDQLEVGDLVHVRGEQASDGRRQPKPQYVQVHGLVGHPGASRRGYARHGYRYPQHRLVVEAAMNDMDYDLFVKRLRDEDAADLIFLDAELFAVHHIDLDPQNNDWSNLQIMTHEAHHRLHAELGKTRSVLYKAVTEEVVSIEPFGFEETYDLEVEDDPHNFIANGFVVHNTGKSIATLAAAAHWAAETKKPTLVVVPMNNLLRQYIELDAPRVEEALGITIRSLMGRNRYLCEAAPGFEGVKGMPEDVVAAEPGFNEQLASDDVVMLNPADSRWFGCPGREEGCDTDTRCSYRLAKSQLDDADIIITNAHLLVLDHQLRNMDPVEKTGQCETCAGEGDRGGYPCEACEGTGALQRVWQPMLFPEYGALFVDECHTLEDILRGFATRSIPVGAVGQLNIGQWLEEMNGKHRDPVTLEPTKQLVGLLRELRDWTEVDDDGKDRLKKHQKAAKTAGAYMLQRGKDNAYADGHAVLWFSPDHPHHRDNRRPSPKLVSTQIDLAGSARRILTAVPFGLVSGTVPKSLRQALGIAEAVFVDCGHPFSYRTQGQLKVSGLSGSFQAVKRDQGNRERRAEEVLEAILEEKGGTLVLFSSYKDLQDVYMQLRLPLDKADLEVRIQTKEGDNAELGRWFKDHGNAVLMGTETFATGFDVPGDALRQVIIWKLPYPGLDPVTRAIMSRSRQRYEDIMRMKVTQAVGRLIRTTNDTGTIFIADVRAENIIGDDDPMLAHLGEFARPDLAKQSTTWEDVY